MKLFQRTLWSFAGVIALQAALAGAALSAIHRLDAGRGRGPRDGHEAANAYRVVQRMEARLLEGHQRARRGRAAGAGGRASSRLARLGRRRGARCWPFAMLSPPAKAALVLRRVGGDLALRRRWDPPKPDFPTRPPSIQEGASLRRDRCRPGRRPMVRRGRADQGPGRMARQLDVFILRKIDADLVSHLSYDPWWPSPSPYRAAERAGRYSGRRLREGGGGGPRFRQGRASDPPVEDAKGGRLRIAILARNLVGRILFAAVVRRTGVGRPGRARSRCSSPPSSPSPTTKSRAARLQRSVLAVSLVVVAFTIIVALLLSRSIVSPIRLLSIGDAPDSRGRLRRRAWRIRVRARSASSWTASTGWPGSSPPTSSSSTSTSRR
jgi:hypothetical protein